MAKIYAFGRPDHYYTVEFHRASGWDRELRLRREAIGGLPPAGSLVFTCNGRGRALFGVRDHDATIVCDEPGGAPALSLIPL